LLDTCGFPVIQITETARIAEPGPAYFSC
jgi:hypothetical protein